MSLYKSRPASEILPNARFVEPVAQRTVTVTAVEWQEGRGVVVVDYREDDGRSGFVVMPFGTIVSMNLHCAA